MLRQLLLPAARTIALARATRWRGLRFLCYHSVVDVDQLALWSQITPALSRDAFQRHLEFIRARGYAVVSMDAALQMVHNGQAERGQYICFTFDDGRLDNYLVAWPLLRSFGYSAHFFVCSGLVGKALEHHAGSGRFVDRYMDAATLRAIVREGGSVGSHGRGHEDLTKLDDVALSNELMESRRSLSSAIDAPVLTHAYPYASYDQRVLNAAASAGYHYAFAVNTGTVTGVDRDGNARLALPRNVMRGGLDPAENYAILRGGFDFAQPYSAIKREIKTWLSSN